MGSFDWTGALFSAAGKRVSAIGLVDAAVRIPCDIMLLRCGTSSRNAANRCELVHAGIKRLKESKQATVSLGLLAALGLGPAALQAPALELLSRKATTVLTNVPGPTRPLYFAGARIDKQMFWVPQTGNIGLGISILSYAGSVYLGMMSDARLVPEPAAIVDRFAAEIEHLMLIRLMFPRDHCPASPEVEALLAGGSRPKR